MAYKGKVEVFEEGKEKRKVTVQMPLFEGDKIVTGKNGEASLMFEDKSIVELHPFSSLTLKEAYHKQGKTKHAFLIQKGKAFFSISKTKGKETKIETPTAIAGIRSTELALEATEESTELAVLEGEVEVESRESHEKTKLKQDEEIGIPRRGKMQRRKMLKLLWAKHRLPQFREKAREYFKSHPLLLKKLKKWRELKKEKKWLRLREMRKMHLQKIKKKERRKRR